MKAFITGGTGFIGKHLVHRLSQTMHTMRCLARKGSQTEELVDLGAQIVMGDVLDRDSLREGMQGCDWVIHLANVYSFWEPDRDIYRRINVEGTLNVMECALEADVSKVVHVSSVAVYGRPEKTPFREDTPVGPERFSEYSRSKYKGEQIAWELFREKGLPLVVVYPCAVLGSGNVKYSGEMVRRFIERRLPVTAFHHSVFTYVHVQDVAEAILRAAEKAGNIGEKYIVGNARLSFRDFYELLSDVSGVPSPRVSLPNTLVMLGAGMLTWVADRIKQPPLFGMSTDAMRLLMEGSAADGSKAEQELGIVYTPIRKALDEECEWYRKISADIWKGQERRSQMRNRVDLPCDVKGLSHGVETREKAQVVDLSRQGMFVTAETPLDEGTEMDAEIDVIQFANTLWVKGKVLRRTQEGMAVRFTEKVPVDIDRFMK
jgi:dihydroflavonol-4-reductase